MSAMRSRQAGRTRPAAGGGAAGRGAARGGGIPKVEYDLVKNKLTKAQATLNEKEDEIDDLNGKIDNLNGEVAALRRKLKTAELAASEARAARAANTGSNEEDRAKIEELERKIADMEKKHKEALAKAQRHKQVAQEVVAEKTTLKQEVERHRRESVIWREKHVDTSKRLEDVANELDAVRRDDTLRRAAEEAKNLLAVRMAELEQARRVESELRKELKAVREQARADLAETERKLEEKATKSQRASEETWRQAMQTAKDAWEGRLMGLQKELTQCRQQWKSELAVKDAQTAEAVEAKAAQLKREHASVVSSLKAEYASAVADLKKNLDKAMKDAKKEYTERSRRDKQDFEARVVQLNAQRRADQEAAEADKEAVIKRAEEVALQAQKTHNARVEALLSRIEMHEAAESEAMRGKAVAEAAMLEVQAQLSHISAARKTEKQAAVKEIAELRDVVARMVKSSEELQTRAGRLVAEAAAQSVAVVEEAAVVNSQHEATIDKLKRVIAQLQATRQFLEDRVVSSSKDAKEAHTELEKCREEVRRMAATQNQLHQQLGLQKQVSMDLLRRFSEVTGGQAPYEAMTESQARSPSRRPPSRPPSSRNLLRTASANGTVFSPLGGGTPRSSPPPPPPGPAPEAGGGDSPSSKRGGAKGKGSAQKQQKKGGGGRHVASGGHRSHTAASAPRSGSVWASVLGYQKGSEAQQGGDGSDSDGEGGAAQSTVQFAPLPSSSGAASGAARQRGIDGVSEAAMRDLLGVGVDITDIAKATARQARLASE